MTTSKALLLGTALLAPLATLSGAGQAAAPRARATAQVTAPGPYQRVLLLSIDGLHAADLAGWLGSHTAANSPLVTLSQTGTVFANAYAPGPSNGFPGILAMTTGGTPTSTGVYYDDSYDRNLFAPGSNCTTSPNPGTEVNYTQAIDTSTTTLFPSIDPTKLPLALSGTNCAPAYPHSFVRTNTVFEAVHGALPGARTAWADDHPSYDILNGPSGTGVDDLFTPELNSTDAAQPSIDYTGAFGAAQAYDGYKVQAIVNEIGGMNSTGTAAAAVPSVFGMNFKSIEVGQRLAKSGPGDMAGLTGGYKTSSGQLGTALAKQFAFVDQQIGIMLAALQAANIASSTLVIVSAKYGDAPVNTKSVLRTDPSSRILKIFQTYYPAYAHSPDPLFAAYGDVALIWLNPLYAPTSNQSYVNWRYNTEHRNALALHLESELYSTAFVEDYGANPFKDNRVPDMIILPWEGVLYTTTTEIADHGGYSNDDLNVALLVSAPNLQAGYDFDTVSTTQIAPTILSALGLPTSSLNSVTVEGTQPLPITLP